MNLKNEYAKTLQNIYKRSIKWEKNPIIHKNKNKIKKKRSKQTNKQKPASTPEQDLHPDWDRSRPTMLYPMSCGEILSLLVASGAPIARKSCTQIMRKTDLYGQNMTFPQKPCCFIKLCCNSAAFRCTFSLL